MDLIVNFIFSYLDEISLRSCEMVCNKWNSVVEGGRFWEQLYHSVSKKKPVLQALLYHHRLSQKHLNPTYSMNYKFLFNSLTKIKKNWNTKNYKTETINFEKRISFMKMDLRRIVFVLQGRESLYSNEFVVVDRFTLETEFFMSFSTENISELQIYNDKIVLANHHGNIFIFDITTKEILVEFTPNTEQSIFFLVKMCVSDELLVACSGLYAAVDGSWDTFVTIYRISNFLTQDAVTAKSEIIHCVKCVRIERHNNRYILFMIEQHENRLKVQLRSTDEFHFIQELFMDDDQFYTEHYAYENGLLVACGLHLEFGQILTLWNVETLSRLSIIEVPGAFSRISLDISNFVLMHYDEGFHIYDLLLFPKTLLLGKKEFLIVINALYSIDQQVEDVLFDEIQIFTVSPLVCTGSLNVCTVNVHNFLNTQ